MIPAMITSAYLSVGSSGTSGFSESALFIEEQIRQSQKVLQQPEFYFPILNRVLPELNDMALIGNMSDWDGFEAKPIKHETYCNAIAFLESLPNNIPAPTIDAEPDGHIAFEWYQSTYRLLSISIGPNAEMNYAALLGQNKAYGSIIFTGETPKELLDLIQRVNPVCA
jgi:hypothetical protein